MSDARDSHTLADLVDDIASADDDDGDISIDDLMDAVGRRSFGPLLLVPGLLLSTPVAGVPGVPTVGALVIVLIAGQMLIGRKSVWLPGFLLRRSISRKRMRKAHRFLEPVARFVDRLIKPRLTWVIQAPGQYLIAVACVMVSLLMPPLEAVPFANTVTAATVAMFGLALTANDGLLALLGYACAFGSVYLLFTGLVF